MADSRLPRLPYPSDAAPPSTQSYGKLARVIGDKLRELYQDPEAEPLPAEHVNLLLALRHKERDRARTRVFD